MSAEAVEAPTAPAEAAPAEAPAAEAPQEQAAESSLEVLDAPAESEAAEPEAEAAPEEPKRKRKSAAERANDRRQRRERLKRENERAAVEREREELRRELAEVRKERQEFRDRLKVDHTGALQELGMSREDILAQQADEANMSPQIRREMMALRQQLAEQDKRFSDYKSEQQKQRAEKRFQQGVSDDVEWISGRGGDRDQYPHLSKLSARKREEFAERAVLQAVKSGDKDATRKTILEDLEDEIAEWAATFAPEPIQASAEPAPTPSEEPVKRKRTRAASARGAAAPSSAKPSSDHERRQSTLALARQLRKEREESKAERRANRKR